MVKSFISGVTGFVGSHLAEYLLSKGEEVTGIKRWRSPTRNIDHILDKITLFDCDLLEQKRLMNIVQTVKPDYIYHLAAQSYVPYSYTNPGQTIEVNIKGTVNLWEAVRSAGIEPMIHCCSSSEVYGEMTLEDIPIKETHRYDPVSPYGASKAAMEVMSRAFWRTFKMNIIMTRAFTHTGPRRGEVFVVSAFAKQIAEIEAGLKEPVLKVGNLASVRTFLDVRDIVRAYWLLLRKCKPGEAYNIGGYYTMTVSEMLDRLLDMSEMRNQIEVRNDKSLMRPKDVTLQVPDLSKFKEATGWKPEIPFDKTLHDTLEYWRKEVKHVGS